MQRRCRPQHLGVFGGSFALLLQAPLLQLKHVTLGTDAFGPHGSPSLPYQQPALTTVGGDHLLKQGSFSCMLAQDSLFAMMQR
jgi:hypothetical protein